ncbi:potassium-transporting ATPase subunit KdpA [Mycobacterium sp.]|uniref:potassium-transporting ATPase subunit KdpA n=1 Tax=Mycobacterium sp. TaxID=1785 RepID=UPI00334243D0|nr:potassium-transporting ATPase subunit [Mycobacterium sp.]
MTANGWLQILVFFALVVAVTPPLGAYMFRVFEGHRQPLPRVLGAVERGVYRLSGVDARREQTWIEYAVALLVFSAFGVIVTYVLQRLQHVLPLNPQKLGPVEPALAFNTAASFTTNTNWQSYAGESTMSYLTQMAALAWHNFTSAAAGMGVALAVARGLTRRPGPDGAKTLGNFWVDLTRAIVYVLLPLSIVLALVLVSQGVLQNFADYREVTTLEGVKQILAMGPVASQEAIKELGTNGGGFFNANSAHPFENPTPLTNLIEMLLIFAIPAGLTFTYGRMARDQRQGWAIFAAMSVLFFAGVTVCYWAEAHGHNLEGKEQRFGIAASTLFATVTTDASCGAVNAMHDSFTPLGGLVPLTNIALGEVIFGGVGAGLYGVLIFVVLTVFIAGLMVGRTPEYLGKKINPREIKLASAYFLTTPVIALIGTAVAMALPGERAGMLNTGPHGLSEVLYAFTSAANNNGSAFAGISVNTVWFNTALGLTMAFGRFLPMVLALALAGSLAKQGTTPASLGTLPTHRPQFVGMVAGVTLILVALTFLPMLALGPIAEGIH